MGKVLVLGNNPRILEGPTARLSLKGVDRAEFLWPKLYRATTGPARGQALTGDVAQSRYGIVGQALPEQEKEVMPHNH